MHRLSERVAATNALLAREIETEFERLQRELLSERDARKKSDDALRRKDRAMSDLFRLLDKNNIPYGELLS